MMMPKPRVKYHPPSKIIPRAITMAIAPLTIRDHGIEKVVGEEDPDTGCDKD
jgi:hypothetical protein